MMTTTNPNTAFKTTDNTHRHNHTIQHHIGRRLLLLTTLLAIAVGVKAQNNTVEMPKISDANNTFWYKINRKEGTNGGYLTSTANASGYLTLNGENSSAATHLWCIVGNDTDGYSFYNKEMGFQYRLGMTGSEATAYAVLTNGNGMTTAFDFVRSDADGYWCIKEHNSTNNYWNERSSRLAYWASDYAVWGWGGSEATPLGGDNGSAFLFTEVADLATVADIEEAKAKLIVGVGYPQTTSAAYLALNALVPNTTTISRTDLSTLVTAYKTSADIQLPEDGKAYQFAFVANNAEKTLYHIVANGNTLSVSTTGPGSTFYCKKFTNVNGEERFAFISEKGKLLSYHTLTDIYAATGSLWNDFTVGAMVGVTSGFVTSTKEDRFGHVYITSSARSSSNAALGCFIYKTTESHFDNSAAPYHNAELTSAIKVTEVTPYTANNAQLLAAAKIEAKVSVLGRKIPGAEVGQYTYTIDGQPDTDDTNAIIEAIEEASTVNAVDAIKESATINQPEVGKCYRIKGYVSGNYLDAINCYTGSQMGIKSYNEYNEQGTMFRLDEGNILYNLGTSSYVFDTYKIGANKNKANKWTFTESERTPGCFTLTSDYNAAPQLHDNGGIYADRCANICGDSHDFVLIEVEIPRTPAPTFVPNDNFTEFTLTCTAEQGYIYYTLDGSDPTGTEVQTLMVGEKITINPNDVNIKAYSHKEDIEPSEVVGIVAISTSEQLANIEGSSYYYLATDNITASSHTSITDFRGTFEGRFYTIKGLNAPLFATTNGATIKNVVLKDVSITGGTGNVGAIVGTAQGKTRIYNCGVLSGKVGDGTNVGSIAGRIEDAARVINCYSFANITSGNTVGGIVGYNAGSYVTGVPQTMVMNCAYYGNLNGGTNRYPIFGGHNITNNQGDNTYNFFRHNESITYKGYNSAQAIFKDEYLDRFEFYRSILNSHRELAAYYAFNDVSNAGEIGKWTLDKSRAPYPIVTKHLSNTRKTLDRTIPSTQEASYAGKKIKDIDVTININGKVYNKELPVTDMDTARWDYTYGKIVLPFANEFAEWSIGDAQAITGWKVSTKDYYQDLNSVFDNKNYVYAQGGNYIVPEGVTALTLTAYVAPAVYLSDASYDVVYGTQYNSAIARGGSTPTTYKGQTVHNTLSAAIDALQLDKNSNLPHEQAIVLVGNYHYNQKTESDVLPQSTISEFNTNKPFTLMSADKDNDQEPDYCFYQFHAHGSGRTMVHPIRFDFVASPGIGMASHVEGAAAVPNIGIWHGKGWFELTETYLGIMQECEIRPGYFLVNAPWIINGGIFEEINMSSTDEYENPNTQSDDHGLTYIRIGGNAYINNFYPGTQSKDATFTTPLKPICMSGGEVVSCYMTGKQTQKSNTSGSVNFYCNGGYIHEFLGAYLEPLAKDQNINVRVDHALIDNFYGGGANENQVTPGNINITINNSQVGFFCGGPKFGNMTNGKEVTINATGTTFGEFYGGGYGGTALTRKEVQNVTINFGGDRTYGLSYESNYKDNRLKYDANLGIAVNYSLQYFMYAGGGGRGVEKFNVDYARLSLAAVGGDITSNLTGCTILNNFYGGGCQGSVTGNITSTLNNCEIGGSAFAAGYTANATPCLVATKEQPTYSKFVLNLGYFTPFGEAYTEEFYWKAADADHEVGSTDDANKTLYTTEEKFTNMGQVTGNTKIVVKGDNSHIYGSVFGGGNASKVIGNTHVHIQGGTIDGNVFGAGNQAEVTGKTEVVIGKPEEVIGE